ncbi:PCF11P-similar protein 4 [Hibiscus trionum]|uniref:PCF11P-similar protein 4 n=1 Tax=Hibiscus trionum TaxID=183268 RepID=A0A9W7H8P7_HIBTR|nr:PCF11P-similar protein 4 [Hibiscus trionum]
MAISNELAQKQLPSISERFKVLLKQREDELMVSGSVDDGDAGATLTTEEIIQLYEIVLSELTFNSKPIITDLTIIAGEQREHGEGIADAICARIIEVPVEQKLPSLYLLDSIVKNIGREYVRHFSSRLPEVFCEAYRQVNPNLHPAMRHLFGTWSTVFPPSVLRKIETQLQFSQSANQQSSAVTSLQSSESPRPTHGIHVNPKYLRQLEQQSGADGNTQHVRGMPAGKKMYGQKHTIGYNEFDSDQTEVPSSHVGVQRLSSTGNVGRTSLAIGANKPQHFSSSRVSRPFSPSTIGSDRLLSSEVDYLPSDDSPRRFAEIASPSRPGFDFGRGGGTIRDEETREWQKKHFHGDYHNSSESSLNAYKLSNGNERQTLRALIDAYGNDRGQGTSNSNPGHVERLDVNGLGNKVAPRSWQNTEEEEFDWEDMSPTLADRRGNEFSVSSVPTFGSIGAISAGLEPNSRSGRTLVDDSSTIPEDAVPSLSSGRGLNQIQRSRYPQDAWSSSYPLSQSSHHLHAKGRGRDFQIPFSASGISSLGGDKIVSLFEKLPESGSQFVRPPALVPRSASSSLDAVTVGAQPAILPMTTGVWPPVNVHKSQPPTVHSNYSLQQHGRSHFDSLNPINAVMNQGQNKHPYMPEKFDSFESKDQSLITAPKLPGQRLALQQRNSLHGTSLQPHFHHEVRDGFLSSATRPLPPRLLAPTFNHGYAPQMHGGMALSNPIRVAQPPLSIPNMPTGSLHFQGGAMPPLPPGPPPTSQMMSATPNAGPLLPNQPQGGAFTGLIGSLMAQGLISLEKPTIQDSVGLEFDADLLKVRYESAISALYADLPRQCTTCGLRFKFQEEHSTHMDWHVTRNRMSKNRKQKPSRKWFVSASMWLSGAEALGTDSVPGFLPAEDIVEKKDDEELAVPADENQSICALCGEPFDDFYSDETEEWMYRGAVYMNAPNGSAEGIDRSQLGPIVHAKCRPESSVVPPEDFVGYDGGNSEDNSKRKRLRS